MPRRRRRTALPTSRTSASTRKLWRALLPAAGRRRRGTTPRRAKRSPSTPATSSGAAARISPGGRGTWLEQHHRGLAGGRPYSVYLPPGVRRGSRVPLLVALHGCTQTAAEFAALTRFNQLADRHRFVVVYPEQTAWSHRNRCWHWYDAAHQRRGVGEPAILAAITREVAAETTRWRIDPTQVYVAGLSAGGGMALVLAATYPDVYAAVGVHSAPAYRSATTGRQALAAMAARATVPSPRSPVASVAPGSPDGTRAMPPAVVIQGSADATVAVRNGELVTTQWLDYRGAQHADPRDPDRVTRSRTTSGRTSRGRRYTRIRWYTARRRRCLEYWLVDGLGHAWSGGAAGVPYGDPRGPRASTAMWAFLSHQALPSR